jgi:hypothetical protein
MSVHVYRRENRKFLILLTGIPDPVGGYTGWTVEWVMERGRRVDLDVEHIEASTEMAALAQVENLLDQLMQS